MNKVEQIENSEVVKGFQRISLAELPESVLMNRIDRKFPLQFDEVESAIQGLENDYLLIQSDLGPVAKYESTYFDTDDFRFFSAHHRGKLQRTKIRYRSYPDTDTHFLEVKRKTIKGRTGKDRILVSSLSYPFDNDQQRFLKDALNFKPEKLKPVITIQYYRLGFLRKDSDERFSVDFNISFSANGRSGHFGNLAIIEVKQDQMESSKIIQLLRERSFRESSMSKYCLSLSQTIPQLKSNRFKPDIRRIQNKFDGKIYA